jgi:hypothetical protein
MIYIRRPGNKEKKKEAPSELEIKRKDQKPCTQNRTILEYTSATSLQGLGSEAKVTRAGRRIEVLTLLLHHLRHYCLHFFSRI